MEQLIEFVGNNLLLGIAFMVVLIMLVKSEFLHQSSKAHQLNPTQATRLLNNENPFVLDVRASGEYDGGHISKAKNIPVLSLKERLTEVVMYKDKAVLAYCKSGPDSAKAVKILRQNGFSKVHNITGGITAWLDAKLPITKK